jgi:taurine dioxygenase
MDCALLEHKLIDTQPQLTKICSGSSSGEAQIVEIRPLRVGVEIVGQKLSEPIKEAVGNQLRSLLAEHQLLVFRNQKLSPDDQICVLALFGNVLDEKKDGKRYQYVSGKETSIKPSRLLFHSDNHYVQVPLELLSLYGEDVGAQATPTLFVDSVAGYERLPQALADRLDGLEIINRSFFHLGYSDRPARGLRAELTGGPVARHPAIWKHPDTGARFVYLSEMHAFRLDGIDPDESTRLLNEVFAILYDPDLIYQHEWANGDLVIWNNRTVQHARGPLPEGDSEDVAARTIRRVSVGPIGFSDQFHFTPEVIAEIAKGDGNFYGPVLRSSSDGA